MAFRWRFKLDSEAVKWRIKDDSLFKIARWWKRNPHYNLDPVVTRSANDWTENDDKSSINRIRDQLLPVSKKCGATKLQIPKALHNAMCTVMDRYPSSSYKKEAEAFARHLWFKRMPLEHDELIQKALDIENELLLKFKIDVSEMSATELEAFKHKIQPKVRRKLVKKTPKWEAINYDNQKTLLYMLARMPADYAVLYRVFEEIKSRDSTFCPKSMLDFGSGVCSSVWAANTIWPNQIYDHLCTDISQHMNEIAQKLMQEGEDGKANIFTGVYFKEFLPVTTKYTYDVVVCANTLIEMHCRRERLRNILSLWRKTEKYLVIVEMGTFNGFRLVSEARDFILQLSAVIPEADKIPRKTLAFLGPIDESIRGHVFAPCSHDLACPMLVDCRDEPCNYEVTFMKQDLEQTFSTADKTRFTYVILKKGARDEKEVRWPRIVRETVKPSRQVECRFCSTDAKLEMTTFTKAKYGKEMFACANVCKWGDRLPVVRDTTVPRRKHEVKRFPKQTNKLPIRNETDFENEASDVVFADDIKRWAPTRELLTNYLEKLEEDLKLASEQTPEDTQPIFEEVNEETEKISENVKEENLDKPKC